MMMASSNLIKDIEENFFQCSVCLEQFEEPKLLPCLHRYCSDCLKTVIQASHDGKIKCPMCKHEYMIPENGVDDFKTDFHIKSMLEFIQLQKSFDQKKLKTCVGCSKNTAISAYCFKCREFLCHQCYTYHISNKLFTDHKPHTLILDNIEANSVTFDKLAALTDDPMCPTHVKERVQLCCSTCGNIPVCVACTFSKHKGHNLNDVTELAKSERELLKPKLAELTKYKGKLYELPQKINTTTEKLNGNVAKKTEILINQHKQQTLKIKDTLTKRTNIRQRGLTDIENRRKEELKLVRDKYDTTMKITKGKYDDELEEFNEQCDGIEGELSRKLGSLDDNLKNITTAKQLLTEQNKAELKQMSDYCEHIIKRYENFTATTSSILASKDAQCIPDIRAASEHLIEEMKKDIPELESLSDFIISDITKFITDDVTITEHEESAVNLEKIEATGCSINGIISSMDGSIVITGNVSDKYSYITVINRKGEIQRHDQMKSEKKGKALQRNCCSFTKFKVITVCIPDEIGIYDVRDGSYSRKNIGDVINTWLRNRRAWCVTIDYRNKHIIVGTNSRYVYVFDYQLNHNHTITLLDVISKSYKITVHRGSLLICDYDGEMAYSASMEGSESKVMFQFTKPDLDGCDWGPRSICTDKTGFIYLLWDAELSSEWRCLLVQYSPDGRQLLMTKSVDGNAVEITTFEADDKEKLLIVTEVGKLYTYGLVVT